MVTQRIPRYGDPEILPKSVRTLPSAQRMPFTRSGELKPGGPGPLQEQGFYHAPDLEGLPWQRKRGDEWTTLAFRQLVLGWLVTYLHQRSQIREWRVVEIASAPRSALRLPEDDLYLVLHVTTYAGKAAECSAVFPAKAREAYPERMVMILDQAARSLDVSLATL